MSYQNQPSAANYVRSLGGGQGAAPSYQAAPAPYVADPYLNRKDASFSPSTAPLNEYAEDPSAPAWAKEAPLPRATWGDAPPPEHHHEQGPGCCARLGAKALSCLVYLFGILGAIVALVVEKHNAYLLANAWQCLFVSIPCIAICLMFAWTSIGSAVLWSAYGFVLLALIIATLIVPYPSIFQLPVVGGWAIKRANYTVEHHMHTRTETTVIREQRQYSTI